MRSYRSFFSYTRGDDQIADWLHRQLDSYRTPKALVGIDGVYGSVPRKLHPIFRDCADLETGGHLEQRIRQAQALEECDTLVVLCSPISAKSEWVDLAP